MSVISAGLIPKGVNLIRGRHGLLRPIAGVPPRNALSPEELQVVRQCEAGKGGRRKDGRGGPGT